MFVVPIASEFTSLKISQATVLVSDMSVVRMKITLPRDNGSLNANYLNKNVLFESSANANSLPVNARKKAVCLLKTVPRYLV